MIELTQEFGFDAAHYLGGGATENRRLHGHSFYAEVTLRGPADAVTGFLRDLDTVRSALDIIRESLDHRLLNDIERLGQPTLENIARYIYDRAKQALPETVRVRVRRPSYGQSCVYESETDMARKLTQLGRRIAIPASPAQATLEAMANSHVDSDYLVRFTAPEFTTLCPITGQPDFAHFVIDYVPARSLVESKSLKLFLASFRNQAAFHEDCTLVIGKRIAHAINPKFLRIAGYWYARGGMPIDVFWQTGKLPRTVWLPDTGVSPYRGRG